MASLELQGRAVDFISHLIDHGNGPGSSISFAPLGEDCAEFRSEVVCMNAGIGNAVEVFARRISDTPATLECSIEIVPHGW